MVPSEAKKIDRYIWGLTPQIRGMVTSAEPTTLEKAILLAASLTDEMVRTGTLTKKQVGGKRKRMEFQGKKTNNDARKEHDARSMDTMRSNADLTQGNQERATSAEVQTI
ncbi:hypothetical protein E3N88_40154 [Mikania micrantha]|uniref:Reverse transcriptase domain-containing protein n=1 Tax=Mikania micrantha TaxID=192012 RepID=A0A5N6LLX1_9ASTR|nr:hypothetical protein E3N88_40154 [Mikania micrantha]